MATVFEIHGPIAMYRKPYTTTSAVSFAFPPPTAIAGLLAAIIGIGNDSETDASKAGYWQHIKGTQIAVKMASGIRWSKHATNFTNTKNPNVSPRIQVKHQFVAHPRYRIYVSGGVEKTLRGFLETGSFIYTPCMGAAYAICNLEYIGSYSKEPVGGDSIGVDTIVPWSEGTEIDVQRSGGAFREIVPFELDENRTLLSSKTVLYQSSVGQKLYLSTRGDLDVTRCGKDVVAWFPKW